MCEVNIDETCTVWNETIIKRARKAHVCDCCGGGIQPGDSYKLIAMVFEGTADSEKECQFCGLMMVLFKRLHRQYMSPSGMSELLAECMADEQTYDEERDEYVPAGPGAWWAVALDEMKKRRHARRT
jgi:hypothetical protein